MHAKFRLVPTAVSKILSFKFISRFDQCSETTFMDPLLLGYLRNTTLVIVLSFIDKQAERT